MRGRGWGSVARAGWRPVGVALVVSVGLHVVWVASAPARRGERQPPVDAISLEISYSLPPEPVELAPSEPPMRREPVPPSVARVRRPGVPRALASNAGVAAPNGAFEPPPREGDGPREALRAADAPASSPRVVAPTLVPSPREVASSLVSAPGGELASAREPRPSICAPSQAAAADSCETDEAGTLAPARLQRSLEASARALRHLSPRPPPRLRRQNDGSYRYQGTSFNAHIELSGHVAFEEVQGSVALQPLAITGVFDLTDTIEHGLLGKERYSSEKRWFLDQTAELRARLADSARAAERMAARRALELALERIVSDPATDPDQKREQVFALWQECGDDAQALDTQRSVEAFVRRYMAQGSRLGYSEAELRRLNEARAGRRAFLPYQALTAGAPG